MKHKKQAGLPSERNESFKSQIATASLDSLKLLYSENVKQEKEIIAFIDDGSVPYEERKKRAPELTRISLQRYYLFCRIQELGYLMTKEEIYNGFISNDRSDNESNYADRQGDKPRPVQMSALTLPNDFELSDEFQKCRNEIEKTRKNLYVTGEAGTGKTTLLTYFRQNTKKNIVVLAPTGIAAINSYGQTIHSFFKFPHALIQKEKIRRLWANGLFERLDLLIIDEVSMVRPDLLDGVDYALRLNRGCHHLPFGGVQVVLIGDLYQLPPILDKELAEHYGELYDTRYFFSANIFKEAQFHSFTLTKNYRQQDEKFMSLLNRIRNNSINETDMRLLNSRVDSELTEVWKDCIRLTPTNAAANSVNHERLSKLPGKEFLYQAKISDEYDRRSHPADEQLRLKIGAQVLMVKNDPDKRWVNGSIGQVVDLASDGIKVQIDHGIYDVQPVKWEKIAYEHDGATGEIVPKVVGTFEQFPVKLAWAVTIHKSQGLTFDRVVVDLDNGAFDHGQTYVGLSRCRTFAGLILKRPVSFSDIIFDKRIHRITDLFIPIKT